jgi:formate dehydrogenase major subunit
MFSVTIDGVVQKAEAGERLIDVVNRTGSKVPQVCYHPQLGPIQTCDTCMVEIGGQLLRACATPVSDGLIVDTKSEAADAAQREAYDGILGHHKSEAHYR